MDINKFTIKAQEALSEAQNLANAANIRKWTSSIWRWRCCARKTASCRALWSAWGLPPLLLPPRWNRLSAGVPAYVAPVWKGRASASPSVWPKGSCSGGRTGQASAR